MNNYLIKSKKYSYIINYYNSEFGFREFKIAKIKNGNINKLLSSKNKNNLLDYSNINLISQDKNICPIHLQLELTDNCNLNCDYCYRSANYFNKINSKYADIKKLKKQLIKYKKFGLLELGITGGEPTLHPEFIEFIKYCTKNFEIVEVLTNGKNNIILEKLINSLSKKQKEKLNITISFNEWYRYKEKFSKSYLFKNLKRLTKIHPIRIVCTDYISSKFQEKKVINFLKSLGINKIDFSRVSPIGRGKTKVKISEYILKYPRNIAFEKIPLNCDLILKRLSIMPDGKIKLCALFNKNEYIGNFYDKKTNLQIFSNLIAPNKEICKTCNYLEYCFMCVYKGLHNDKINCKYKKFFKLKYPYLFEMICNDS
jgi:radical SAM protein with 4Fe4S-binding SPASM domain